MRKLNRMKSKVITIIGNVASGKSSAMEIITRAVKGKAINADDLFQTSDPFREAFLEDLPRWALANELWLTKERAKILRREIDLNISNNMLVVDSGLLMSWVYTYSHFLAGKITRDEWELYEDLYESLSKGLVRHLRVVYLDYQIETLMYRLRLRGRDYELAYYTEDYLLQLQAGLLALINKLHQQKVQILSLSENDIPDFVVNQQGARQLNTAVQAWI